jgi:uncharacterized protein YehS (DUF1456 family)
MSNLDPLGYLSPAEREEVESLNQYLREHSKSDFRNMPEKTVAKVLNGASPNVRFFMNANKNVVDDLEAGGGRYKPFQERITPELDKDTQAVFDRTRTEEITHGLNERMGTSTQAEPATLRDIVSASMDAHEHD